MSETSASPTTSATPERDLTPTPEFAAQANGTADLYDAGRRGPRGLLGRRRRASASAGAKDFDQTLDWSGAPFAKWFVGGELNAAYNCVDRHVEAGNGDRVAIHFEGEGGDTRTITYAELQRDVAKAANALESLGVAKGDRVAIYLPMIPEAVAAMLACARIGAPHSVVFGGLLGRRPAHPHRRRRGQGRHHRRRPVPPWQGRAAQAGGRRGGRRRQHRREGPRRAAHQGRGGLERRARRLVARRRRLGQRRSTRRAPHDSEHPLFILYTSRHDGEAQGHLPHDRRLPHAGGLHELGRPRRAPRDRRLLVHRRHRLGDRPLLHRLRTAGQRRDPGHLRGHARHPAPGPLVGDRARSTR